MKSGSTTIVFDGDQTLWDFQSAMVRSLAETRIEISRVIHVDLVDVPSVESLIEIRDQIAASFADGNKASIRRHSFAQILRQLGHQPVDATVDRITEFFVGRRYELCRPYHDTVPALTLLRGRYSVALLTNGQSYPERMGLRSLFDHVLAAEQFSAMKPDATVYAAVMKECGGDHFVSVGDSLMNEVVAPQQAGWKAVWINRDGRELPDQVHPDATLATLDGLDIALRTILG